jgi:hypothetical protein
MSSSAEDKEVYEVDVDCEGEKILSLIWLDRHRGVGIERRYGAFGGQQTYGTHMSIAAMNCNTFFSDAEFRRLLIDGVVVLPRTEYPFTSLSGPLNRGGKSLGNTNVTL